MMRPLTLVLVVMPALAQTLPVDGVGHAEMPVSKALPPVFTPRALPDWASVAVELDAVDILESRLLEDQDSTPGPLRIGFNRDIPELHDPDELWSRQAWYWTSGGGLAFAFRMTSPGALALRLGVRVLAMPDGTTLRFHAPGVEQVQKISGAEVKASLRRNFDAGEVGEEAETFWSPVIEGEAVTLEIELPASIDPDEVDIALPRLSHLFQLPYSDRTNEQTGIAEKAAAACNQDVMCDSAWDAKSRATARMLYTKSGSSYFCTGTLLNDTDTSTFIPYFLAANHCVSTQTAASSLQTYWFWRSTYCNSGVLGSYQARTGGADLLYASATTDTSFMRLKDVPPGGSVFSGWSATVPAPGAGLMGVHHPAGDLQKISRGSLGSYWNCVDRDGGFFYCSSTSTGTADHFSVSWQSGITEGGSSGSGIFLNDTQQLVGTLHGGSSSCGTPADPDFYGRFDIPYQAALHQWLNTLFGDVDPSSWAAGYIYAIRNAGITGGCGNGNYCPQGLVTREQMAAFLIRAVEGEPAANYCDGSSYFSDVSSGAWSCPHIKRLSEMNITGGCGGGNYCPQGLVTRDQMAAFIVRAVEGEPALDYCGGVAPFMDVPPSAWSCRYIKRLAEIGVTQGCGNGNYCPYATVTREEMAAFLARAFLDMD